ncbi:MAG: hypothetical protein E6G35_15615 [Actinobacteria bacterium]|nr:MAG: hypothetical protein E6G35_15615 [Actinomycetota bacterium]
MAPFRRIRWIAITAVAVTATAIFAIGADAFADRGHSPCQPVGHASQVQADHSWRTGGFRSAGCRAWRHLHQHRFFARTP